MTNATTTDRPSRVKPILFLILFVPFFVLEVLALCNVWQDQVFVYSALGIGTTVWCGVVGCCWWVHLWHDRHLKKKDRPAEYVLFGMTILALFSTVGMFYPQLTVVSDLMNTILGLLAVLVSIGYIENP